MLVIDFKGEIQSFFNEIKPFEIGWVRLNKDTYELAQGIDDELLLVHSKLLDQKDNVFFNKLKSQKSLVLFDSSGDSFTFPNEIFSFSRESNSKDIYKTLWHLDFLFKENNVLKSQLFSLNKEVASIMGSVETELLRVKKLYEHNVPRRYKDLKGLKVLSKYAAGESIGGEFFDLFENDQKIFLLMSDTSSYLASSSILSLFTNFKNQSSYSQKSILNLLEEIRSDILKISKNKTKEIKANLLLMVIDQYSYEVTGYVFGDFKAISSLGHQNMLNNDLELLKTEKLDTAQFEFKLSRDERLLITSPGLARCWSKTDPVFMLEELINKDKVKLIDILDEIFFQLKKNRKSGFLPHDASAIIMEVQKNVILQV